MCQDQGLCLTVSSLPRTPLLPGFGCLSEPMAGMDEDCSFPDGVMRDGVRMSGLLAPIPIFLE